MRISNCFVLAAMAVLPAMTVTAADVSGKWMAQVPGRNGQMRDTTFNLKADGDKLTGTMTGPQGDVEIKDGKRSPLVTASCSYTSKAWRRE